MSSTSRRYSPEVRERAVRMVFEHQHEHGSQWAAIVSFAAKIGCTPETLRNWVRRAEVELAVAYRREEPPPALAAFLETLAQVAGELESPAPVELVSAREQLHTARPAGV